MLNLGRNYHRLNIEPNFPDCESAVLNQLCHRNILHFAEILIVGSSPGRGMRLNLPIDIVPLRHTDTGFQPPAAYLGDEQMLRILGRGHSVATVTELIFVRA
jgi:hypothetical protein